MGQSKPIRVMLVDDHAVVRSGLGAFLMAFDDLELVGEASSGPEALTKCAQLRPDVVLMDLVMPGMDGATATKAIRQTCPQIQVIALTSFKEDNLDAYAFVETSGVGGTHPALVEAMAFGNCVVTHDTPENLETLGRATLLMML